MQLTKIEIELIDQFLLKTCVEVVTSAHVDVAIANTLPTFRAEQLANNNVFDQYMETFNEKNSVCN